MHPRVWGAKQLKANFQPDWWDVNEILAGSGTCSGAFAVSCKPELTITPLLQVGQALSSWVKESRQSWTLVAGLQRGRSHLQMEQIPVLLQRSGLLCTQSLALPHPGCSDLCGSCTSLIQRFRKRGLLLELFYWGETEALERGRPGFSKGMTGIFNHASCCFQRI